MRSVVNMVRTLPDNADSRRVLRVMCNELSADHLLEKAILDADDSMLYWFREQIITDYLGVVNDGTHDVSMPDANAVEYALFPSII
jgi:hypothetical protein